MASLHYPKAEDIKSMLAQRQAWANGVNGAMNEINEPAVMATPGQHPHRGSRLEGEAWAGTVGADAHIRPGGGR